MAASADQITEIRSWIGADPDDPTLQLMWARLGGVHSVALEVTRTAIVTLLDNPVKASVEGEISEDWSENLKELRSRRDALVELAAQDAAAASGEPATSANQVTIGHFLRPEQACR